MTNLRKLRRQRRAFIRLQGNIADAMASGESPTREQWKQFHLLKKVTDSYIEE
jgi:hypothetical protein